LDQADSNQETSGENRARACAAAAPPLDLGQLAILVEKLRPAQEPADPLVSVDRIISLTEKLRPVPQNPTDGTAAIRQLAETLTVLREAGLMGNAGDGGETSSMSGWQQFLRDPLVQFLELLKPFSNVGAAVLQHNLMKPKAAQGSNAPPPDAGKGQNIPVSPDVGPTQMQSAQPTGTAPETAAGPPPGAPVAPTAADAQTSPSASDDPAAMAQMQLVGQLMNQLVPNMMNHYRHKWGGRNFAGYVGDGVFYLNGLKIDGYGLLEVAQNVLKVEDVINILKGNPNIWSEIDSEANFRKFLEEFFQGPPDEEPANAAA
jgi:hypothetical protein